MSLGKFFKSLKSERQPKNLVLSEQIASQFKTTLNGYTLQNMTHALQGLIKNQQENLQLLHNFRHATSPLLNYKKTNYTKIFKNSRQ